MKVFIQKVYDDQGNEKGEIYLESDALQFMIREYNGKSMVNTQTGRETEQYKSHGYFPNIASALNHVLKMKVMDSTATKLRELHEDITSIKQWIYSNFDMNVAIKIIEGKSGINGD